MSNQLTVSHFELNNKKNRDQTKVLLETFSCDLCEIVYDTKDLLEQHFFTKCHNKRVEVNNSSKNRQVTESSFKSECQMDKAQTKVMFEIFSCGICEKDYETKELLATHCETKYHKKRKLDVSYFNADDHFEKLKQHKTLFYCEFCNERFELKSVLDTHIKSYHQNK